MPAKSEIPLDLPEIRLLNTELGEREIVITVESTRAWANCAPCGAENREFHSSGRRLRLRHLPILGRPVIIEIRPQRFRCPTCDNNPPPTQKLACYDERSPHTKAYDQWLLLQLIGSTLTDVARKEQVTYDAVLGALRRPIAAAVSWEELEQLEVLGLDEIALKKGQRDFVVLVTTRQAEDQLKLLGVLPDRKSETVEKFLWTLPAALRATVREVCSDMYEAYASTAKKVLPQAQLVADRFHVAKCYRACADQLRSEAQRDLKSAGPAGFCGVA
jgi:transposase